MPPRRFSSARIGRASAVRGSPLRSRRVEVRVQRIGGASTGGLRAHPTGSPLPWCRSRSRVFVIPAQTAPASIIVAASEDDLTEANACARGAEFGGPLDLLAPTASTIARPSQRRSCVRFSRRGSGLSRRGTQPLAQPFPILCRMSSGALPISRRAASWIFEETARPAAPDEKLAAIRCFARRTPG